jgi:large-conductance mechanosensitive channel
MGTGLLRLFSSKATLGTGNAIVATTENAAALSISALSFFIPVVIAILVIALIVWIIVKLTKRFSKKPVRV